MTPDQLKQKVEFDGFSEEDMIRFGNYLVSSKRRKSFKNETKSLSLNERLSRVHHADIGNFKESLLN